MLFFPYLCRDIIFIVMEEEKPKKKRKQKAAEGSKERKANWKEYTASVEDIKAFLSDHVYLRHNVITRRVECRLPSNYEHDGTDWQPVTDRIVNSLWAELSKEKPARVQDVYRVIESDFVPEYHPFRFYLENLPPWDGENHILAMSLSVSVRGDVDTQMRFAEYLTKWLVGMVAGWVDDAVVNNVILVLIGEQGSYKTTWFNYLLPPELRCYFYTKTNANRMGRDDLLTLAQYGLVCCEELDTMRPSELNQLKAAVTMPSIDERAAYAHYHEHRKHIASFCGIIRSSSAIRRATAAGCPSRWRASNRRGTIPSTMRPSTHKRMPSIRKASSTGSPVRRSPSSRRTTATLRHRGWSTSWRASISPTLQVPNRASS